MLVSCLSFPWICDCVTLASGPPSCDFCICDAKKGFVPGFRTHLGNPERLSFEISNVITSVEPPPLLSKVSEWKGEGAGI